MNRIVGVGFSCELLLQVLTTGGSILESPDCIIRCSRGLPEGAIVVGAAMAEDGRSVVVRFQHESFPDLAEGESPPLRSISFEVTIPEKELAGAS